MSDSDHVQKSVSGVSGRLVLDRPKALNSLDPRMVRAIHAALDDWAGDDSVRQVVVTSSHEKAFCAGGDVRAVRSRRLEGDDAFGDDFFREEYAMNAAIAEYPKPYVAIIDGIAMGGGLGVSLHGSHRVVTERTMAAMPEMAIGFTPDVGITHLTQRVPTAAGSPSPAIARFAGLTGHRLSAADMLWAGWATHFVPSESIDALLADADADGIDAALERHARPAAEAGESELARLAPCVTEIFSRDSWAEIERALDDNHCAPDDVRAINALLQPASPTSLVAAAELYAANAAEDVDLRTALDNEYAVGRLLRLHPNFAEGVRAVLVDKDRNAMFDPASPSSVDPAPYREALGR